MTLQQAIDRLESIVPARTHFSVSFSFDRYSLGRRNAEWTVYVSDGGSEEGPDLEALVNTVVAKYRHPKPEAVVVAASQAIASGTP